MGMSREEAIDLLDNLIGMVEDNHNSDYDTALHMAIKALEQEPVIDKIRAEIETKYGQCSLIEYHVSCDGYANTNDMGDVADMLQIIDKYKTEQEET